MNQFLLGFPVNSEHAIVINYCIVYAKYYIYLEKLKTRITKNMY